MRRDTWTNPILILLILAMGIATYIRTMGSPTVADLAAQAQSSVVMIQDCGTGALGSGFAVAPDLICTARHIVETGGPWTITTMDGTEYLSSSVVSHLVADVAFIQIDGANFRPLRIGSLRGHRPGDVVFSIGTTSMLEQFNSVAIGNIQKLQVTIPDQERWGVLFSQTAEGGGGNSGCPVFDMRGRVIGVWVASYQSSIHYCIPVDMFKNDLPYIRAMLVQGKYWVSQ